MGIGLMKLSICPRTLLADSIAAGTMKEASVEQKLSSPWMTLPETILPSQAAIFSRQQGPCQKENCLTFPRVAGRSRERAK
jgi:hypothetical protein